MTRETDRRIGDILQAIDRCRRYVASLDHADAAL